MDFDATFVRIGRFACEEHYRVGRITVNRWLEECGKDRLIAARAEKAGPWSKNWSGERPGKISRGDMGRVLKIAFPVEDSRRVSPIVTSQAARFLRIMRNGGHIVSRTGQGDWRIGTRRVSPAELIEIAMNKGFEANLPAAGGEEVGCENP